MATKNRLDCIDMPVRTCITRCAISRMEAANNNMPQVRLVVPYRPHGTMMSLVRCTCYVTFAMYSESPIDKDNPRVFF